MTQASITQTAQIGVEATSGTPVTADKLLASIMFNPGVSLQSTFERPQGVKAPTGQQIGKEWVEGSIEGYAGYNDLAFLFASYFVGGVTPSGAGPYDWQFAPDAYGADVPDSFTVEQGDDTLARQYAYTVINDLGLAYSHDRIALSGSFFAQEMSEGTQPMATTVPVENLILQPSDTTFYLDTTSGGIGTTKLTGVIGCDLAFGQRWSKAMFADAAEPSFAGVVDGPLTVNANLTLEAESQASGLLADFRAGTMRYFRWETTDGTYTLTVDIAVRVEESHSDFSDSDGVYAVPANLRGNVDLVWDVGNGAGTILDVNLTNNLASFA